MVATWDDSDEETLDEEESHEVSNLALMAIEEEIDEVRDLPSYDELFEAFTKLHNDLKKIGMKNVSLKKKMVEISNENDDLRKQNDSLNEEIKGLKLENKTLHDRIASLKKHRVLHVNMKSYVLMIRLRKMKI